jgi:hypothetical protein
MATFAGQARTFRVPEREPGNLPDRGGGRGGGYEPDNDGPRGPGTGRPGGPGDRSPGEPGAPEGTTYFFFDLRWLQNPRGEKQELAAQTTFTLGKSLNPVAVTNSFAKLWAQVDPPVSWATETVPINTVSNISGQNYENTTNFSLVRVDDTVAAQEARGFIDATEQLLLENAEGKQTAGGVTYSERALVEIMFDNIGHKSTKPAYAPDGKLESAPFLFVSDVGHPENSGGGGGGGDGGSGGDGSGGDGSGDGRGDPIPPSSAFRPDAQLAREAGGTLVDEQGAPNSTLVQWATVVGGTIALLSYIRS